MSQMPRFTNSETPNDEYLAAAAAPGRRVTRRVAMMLDQLDPGSLRQHRTSKRKAGGNPPDSDTFGDVMRCLAIRLPMTD